MHIAAHFSPTLGIDLAFALGWDHAHYGIPPDVDLINTWPQLAQGYHAGQQTFRERTLQATPQAHLWLRLRGTALEQGRAFDTEQITPRYLQLIDTSHCPVTRCALTYQKNQATDSAVARVFNDAAYAAGNLAVMSMHAQMTKHAYRFDETLRFMHGCENGADCIHGLDGQAWARMVVLSSYVQPLDHAQAATLPMLVLPPNRLRVFNPIQALQALVCRLVLSQPIDLPHQLQALIALFPGQTLRKDMVSFVEAYVAQVVALHTAPNELPWRWSVEDAWQTRLVHNRWKHLARQLTANQAQDIVQAQGSGIRTLPDHQATEGWALATRGYLSPRPSPRLLADPHVNLPSAQGLSQQSALFKASA